MAHINFNKGIAKNKDKKRHGILIVGFRSTGNLSFYHVNC